MDKNLIVRTFSAVSVIVLLFVLFHFFNKTGLILFTLVIIFFGSNEFARMFFKDKKAFMLFFNTLSLINLILFYTLSMSPFVYLSLIIISLFTFIYYRKTEDTHLQLNTIALTFTGFFYTIVLPFFCVKILSIPQAGLYLFVTVLSLSFANDIFAYVCGRLFGKNKILPFISPKKTIAGSVGGTIAASITAYYLLSVNMNLTTPVIAIIIGAISSVAGQTGDFYASLLKRVAKVKDSGKIMPGHGGVLDRLDGVYFVAPIFYAFYYLFIT